MCKKGLITFLTVIASVSVVLAFAQTAYAKSQSEDASDSITTTEYFLFSDLVYEDLDDYEGKAISTFISNDKVISKSAKKTYKNSTGSVPVPAIMTKYIGDWVVDKVFVNNRSGFYGAAFKNIGRGDIVIAFRGTTDAIGKDGLNDAEFGLMTKNSPQMDDAIDLTEKYINENINFHIGVTGHSLGGGLAIELSHYYHFNSETFNAAQITASLYYNNWDRFSAVYKGFNTWKHIDHVNEQDLIVGTFEYGAMKKAVKHKNLSNANKFFAHAMQHMLTIDSKNATISLSDQVDKNFLQGITDIYKDVNDYSSISLGSTKSNILESRKVFINNDVFLCGDGDDYVNAKGGNDVLIGGKGNDILDGGTDDDIYIYHDGDGVDTVIDPGGQDMLTLYSNGKDVQYREEEYYYIVSLDGEDILKIDKASRLDGFCSVAYGNEENKSKDSFTIKVIDNKNHIKKHKIKLNGNWHQVKKANIEGLSEIEILDSSHKVVATLKNEPMSVTLPRLSAYVAYDNAKNIYTAFIYSKDNNYYFHIKPVKNQKMSILLDTQLIDKTHVKYTANDIKAKTDDVFTLRRTNRAPILTKNNKIMQLEKLSYTEASKVKLNRRMIIMRKGATHRAMTVKTTPAVTSSKELYWSSNDENVAKVTQDGRIKGVNAGEAVIAVNVDGVTDSCRIYVLPTAYIAIIYAVIIILALLLITHLVRKTKRIIKKHKKISAQKGTK